jgi:hypothetical protein
MSKRFPPRVRVSVTQDDIDKGKCGDQNKCMIKISVARAINVPHGYVRVDATGISVTRRPDYREKAFIPRQALANMLRFDKDKDSVKPFYFWLVFHKTTPVAKASEQRKEAINRNRRENDPPSKRKKYHLNKRIAGIAIDKELAAELGYR